jgi:hypothetical protein
MTREQFHQLLYNPSTIDLNMVAELEDVTQRFPFFHNAHILLTKQYHGHQNIRYENYLRKAAAYAPDRTRLFRLIREEPVRVIHKGEENLIPEPAETLKPAILDETLSTRPAVEDHSHSLPAEPPVTFKETEKESTDDPREIIAKRLREIEQQNESNESGTEQEQDEKKSPIESEITNRTLEDEEFESNTLHPSENIQDSQQNDRFLEQEHGEPEIHTTGSENDELTEKDDIQETEVENQDLREREEGVREVIPPQPEFHSFSEWLRLKSGSANPVAGSSSGYDIEQTLGKTYGHGDDLIDRFIESEPRIMPAKSEFYSPGNMARKSAMEHEDLISETLARIYAQQGHIPKAIDAYRRLSLKLPEKSAYFAGLIQELEKQLDS